MSPTRRGDRKLANLRRIRAAEREGLELAGWAIGEMLAE